MAIRPVPYDGGTGKWRFMPYECTPDLPARKIVQHGSKTGGKYRVSGSDVVQLAIGREMNGIPQE